MGQGLGLDQGLFLFRFYSPETPDTHAKVTLTGARDHGTAQKRESDEGHVAALLHCYRRKEGAG